MEVFNNKMGWFSQQKLCFGAFPIFDSTALRGWFNLAPRPHGIDQDGQQQRRRDDAGPLVASPIGLSNQFSVLSHNDGRSKWY